MLPWQWSVQKILSSFKSTTREIADRFEDPCYERYVILTFVLPALVIFLIIYFPIYLTSLIIWALIQRYRVRHYCLVAGNGSKCTGNSYNRGDIFNIALINACLLSESEARNQNLANCQTRARQIANCLLENKNEIHDASPGSSESLPSRKRAWDVEEVHLQQTDSPSPGTISEYKNLVNKNAKSESLYSAEKVIRTDFPPDLGIVVFNHVTDRRAEDKLLTITKDEFPYSISKVGINSWASNRFNTTSGVMALSRFPILLVRFYPLPANAKRDRKKSEGLLVFVVGL